MIRVADEVREALASRGAVVALETTLVAHGFPPGEGVEVGLESERQVRAAGAVPATVGVLDGEVRVGLTAEAAARLYTAPDPDASASRILRASPRCGRNSLARLPPLVARPLGGSLPDYLQRAGSVQTPDRLSPASARRLKQ